MSVNDKTKLEAYEELIAGLERENKIQNRLIEAQSAMIQTLEEHNAELEKIISELSNQAMHFLQAEATMQICLQLPLQQRTSLT